MSGSPDMGSSSQPLYLIPDDAVHEEQQEDGINDESTLDNPHGDSVNILKGCCLGWVVRGGGEGTGDEERK